MIPLDEINTKPAQRNPACVGFTIVELMVASTVMSVLLLGVYSVFQQSVEVEEKVSHRFKNRMAATAVVGHMADAVMRSINVSGIPTIVAGEAQDGAGHYLICMSQTVPTPEVGTAAGVFDVRRPTHERLRYRWGFVAEDLVGTVTLQRMSYAGTVNVTHAGGGELPQEEALWALLPRQVIGSGVASLSIQYRPADDPQADWRTDWSGNVGNVVVRMRVTVSGETAERVLVPMPSGLLIEGGGE